MAYTFEESRKRFAIAQKTIPGGVNSGIRLMEKPVPLYFTHGKGSRIWDVDDNEYIDYQIGQGAILYGHAPDGMVEALCQQAAKGIHWAAQCDLELEVSQRLCRMVPSVKKVRFNNCATEAVAAAFRLARSYTGRSKILKFEGHYHGWLDEGLVGFAPSPDEWGPDDAPTNLHPSRGVIQEVLDRFVVARWNDPGHLRVRIEPFAGQIAAIIFEPVVCNTSCLEPVKGMMQAITELCRKHGIIMIADETITGFRFGTGGAQSALGIDPDLTIFGKAVGGGTPFAALAGKSHAFEPIAQGNTIHAGTLNANPLCLAASNWCLQYLESLGDKHPNEINNLGKTLMAGLSDLAHQWDIPLVPQGPGLTFHTTIFKSGQRETTPIRDYRDYIQRHDAPRWAHLRRCLLEEGVRAIERGLWFLSLAHTADDIQETLDRSKTAFRRHAETWSA